jgi:hypothetical protein
MFFRSLTTSGSFIFVACFFRCEEEERLSVSAAFFTTIDIHTPV